MCHDQSQHQRRPPKGAVCPFTRYETHDTKKDRWSEVDCKQHYAMQGVWLACVDARAGPRVDLAPAREVLACPRICKVCDKKTRESGEKKGQSDEKATCHFISQNKIVLEFRKSEKPNSVPGKNSFTPI